MRQWHAIGLFVTLLLGCMDYEVCGADKRDELPERRFYGLGHVTTMSDGIVVIEAMRNGRLVREFYRVKP